MCIRDSYFAVLGIPENTDDERVIKSAYRKMALRHHSDRGGRDADMVKVNRAYEVLRLSLIHISEPTRPY